MKLYVVKKKVLKPLGILIVLSILFFWGCDRQNTIYNTGKKDYTNIFNDAVSTSDYIIIKAGSYHLSAPVYLHSNTVIIGEGKVILIKSIPYSHVFTNISAAKDYTTMWDKSITIINIIIDANNRGNQKDAVHSTANGDLSFKFLNHLTLRNIKIINGDSNLFGIHLQSVKNAMVKNYSYDGNKDGFHINGGCEDVYIDGFNISSFDDAFAIMTDDYPRVQHNAQDIRKVTITNGVSRKRFPQTGFFLRLMTGSWEDWKKGNKYNIGHTVNYKTHQYKKLNSGKLVSTECPCQLNGDSLYSDGIIWRYIGEGVNKTSNIHNISVFDVKLDDGRKIVRTINADSNDYGEYPGTENMSVLDSVYTEGYRLNITKGAVGVWKTIPAKNQDILDILLVLIILLITIISYYFLTNKKFEKIIHK